jgi:hypothetical protein
MSTLKVLKEAKEIISDEKSWQKGSYVSADGKCLCSLGAITKAVNSSVSNPIKLYGSDVTKYLEAQSVLRSALPLYYDVHTFNDLPETTHKDIMEVFDKAIEKVS